jgi:protein phosphatase
MPDSWFYLHQGTTCGPVNTAALCMLAAQGKLAPGDLVWPEGKPAVVAVPASKVVTFAPGTAPAAAPDWLGDVGKAEPLRAGGPSPLDWIDDVRRVESTSTPPGAPSPQARRQAPTQLQTSPVPAPPSSGQALLSVGSATSPGVVRERNEDSFLVLHSSWANLDNRHEMAIVVVADGMGGYQGGERASGLAIAAMGKALAPLLVDTVAAPPAAGGDGIPTAIAHAFDEGHRAVLAAANEAGHQEMGATAVAVVVLDDTAHVGLAGDCRVYHQHGNQLAQITRDQTLVNRMVQLGQLTPEEAANHPRRNEVTQALGMRSAIEPVRYSVKLQPGDWLVIACDGLYAHVEDARLREEVGKWTGSVDGLAKHLVDLTNGLGGSDNCTVVIVQYRGVAQAVG